MELPQSGKKFEDVSLRDLFLIITSLSLGSAGVILGVLGSVLSGTWYIAQHYQTAPLQNVDGSTPVKAMNDKIATMTSDLAEMHKRQDALTQQLNKATQERDEARRESRDAIERVGKPVKQVAELEGELRDATGRETELAKKVTELQSQLRGAPLGGGGGAIAKRPDGAALGTVDSASCLDMQRQWAGERSVLGAPEALKWNVNANQIRTRIDQRFLYSCPANGSIVSVYGGARRIYGTGSGICAAAVHRGLISASEGGTVAIKIDGGAEQLIRGGPDHGVSASYVNGGASTFHFIDPVSGGELSCQ